MFVEWSGKSLGRDTHTHVDTCVSVCWNFLSEKHLTLVNDLRKQCFCMSVFLPSVYYACIIQVSRTMLWTKFLFRFHFDLHFFFFVLFCYCFRSIYFFYLQVVIPRSQITFNCTRTLKTFWRDALFRSRNLYCTTAIINVPI